MRFTPVYDAHNRLRVRCGDYAFTKEQACGIADLLGSLDFVEHAESNWRTGSILVMYRDGARQQVLDARFRTGPRLPPRKGASCGRAGGCEICRRP